MNFNLPAHKYRTAISQSRISPISGSASLLTLGLGTVGLTTSIITKFSLVSLPNITLLVVGVVVLDVLSQFARQTRIAEAIQTALYGFLYLAVTIVCGILTAYSMQRFALPLQDRFLASADRALGLNWSDYAYWVDGHVVIQTIFHLAYNTIAGQILLPLVVLAFSNRVSELRAYLLAFAIAFAFTIIVSALLPAAGPIVFVDRETFNVLQFTGATPVDHLMRLREAGPLIMSDAPGGIATFPSFHATIAILTPLTLRSYPRIFVPLLVLDAAMLGGTVTEGAHYFSDILAGASMAFFAHSMAKRIIGLEDRSLHHRSYHSISRQDALQAA
jgi:membrane-associated phospholipid phosphatase